MVVVYQVSHELRVLLEQLLGTLQPHHHERRGIGIGLRAIVAEHSGREDVVLHGVSRLWVDSVCIASSVLIVEVTIVATGGHCLVRDIEYGLQLTIARLGIFGGFGDPNLPG